MRGFAHLCVTHSAIGPVFLLADLSQASAIKENPKRGGGQRPGPKTAFVGLGGTGELSRMAANTVTNNKSSGPCS